MHLAKLEITKGIRMPRWESEYLVSSPLNRKHNTAKCVLDPLSLCPETQCNQEDHVQSAYLYSCPPEGLATKPPYSKTISRHVHAPWTRLKNANMDREGLQIQPSSKPVPNKRITYPTALGNVESRCAVASPSKGITVAPSTNRADTNSATRACTNYNIKLRSPKLETCAV
jgi:hypothetical protein